MRSPCPIKSGPADRSNPRGRATCWRSSFFSTNPLNVVSFTQHDEVVQAVIEAGGVGRGLGDTDVGRAMLAAIGEFEQRPYSGSRLILLVSDGGTHLADPDRKRIRAGML